MSASKVVKKRYKPTFSETFLSRTVTVKVGFCEDEYQVHKAVLMHYSEYFRDKLKREDFKENTISEGILKDIGPVPFEALIDWMYSRKLPYRTDDWIKYGGKEDSELYYVVGLNILAHCLVMPELKRPALKLAVDVFNSRPHPGDCIFGDAFKDLPKDHPFLQLLIDHHCRSYRPTFYEIEDFLAENSHEAVARVLQKYSEMEDRNIPLKLSDYLKD